PAGQVRTEALRGRIRHAGAHARIGHARCAPQPRAWNLVPSPERSRRRSTERRQRACASVRGMRALTLLLLVALAVPAYANEPRITYQRFDLANGLRVY